MSEHTALPWIVAVTPLDNPSVVRLESRDEHGVVNDGWIIAEFHGPDAEANAEFIIQACSSHKDLLTACEMCFTACYMSTTDFLDTAQLATLAAAIENAKPQ